jgi:hypothetical protein
VVHQTRDMCSNLVIALGVSLTFEH